MVDAKDPNVQKNIGMGVLWTIMKMKASSNWTRIWAIEKYDIDDDYDVRITVQLMEKKPNGKRILEMFHDE